LCACCAGGCVVGSKQERVERETVTERGGIAYSVECRNHGMDDLRFEFRQMKNIFLFFQTSRLGLGHRRLLVGWVPGFFLRVKQLELEVDHAPPYSAEVKNDWIYTSTPTVCLRGVDRDKCVSCNGSSNMRDMCLFFRFCVLGLCRKELRKLGSQ
jgi:hypothetical protein